MEAPALTTEMILVLALLVLAIVLFASEIIRVDAAALLIMTLLGLMIYMPGLDSLLSVDVLFSGFSSNAVISIIAVMILGGGLDRTGVMTRVAAKILKYGGKTEKRILALVAGAVGVTSSFMQNVGAAALFLPVVARISAKTQIPLSRLLMPMGFCAILGGTLTMVGSSPLIMLNDLMANANRSLPEAQQMESFGLFAVAPVGIVLLACGLIYFVGFGHAVLPDTRASRATRGGGTLEYLKRIYDIDAAVHEVLVPVGSPLVGRAIQDVQTEFEVRIIASRYAGKTLVSTPVEAPIAAPAILAVIAEPEELKVFLERGRLHLTRGGEFAHNLSEAEAGIAEVVVPPDSPVIGKTVRDLQMRMTYGLSLISIFRGGENIRTQLPTVPFQAGDTLVCHTRWEHLARVEQNRDFVVVTSEYPHEKQRPHKVALALSFFALSLTLVLFTEIALPIALLSGAIGMIVTGVLTMDEAYDSVSWKTVFILAGLLPLGIAVENSGTANWIAQSVLWSLGDVPVWTLQLALAILATAFTLVMSNVGATVLLVPVAVNLAIAVDASPAMFALTVAVSTSNSFLIPTHQVNALIMGPGGYRVADFLRVGGIMTVLFLIVSLLMLNLFF
jgi:di/tricarboxylate transporter